MQPSTRIRSILQGGASGWEIVFRAWELARKGVEVTNLTIGEHEQPTPAPILDAMSRAARDGATGYSAIPGIPDLRAAAARRAAARSGAPAGPENVIITAGGQSALFHAFQAVLDPGDAAVIIDPQYPTYPGTIRACGGEVRVTPALASAGFQPDLEALDAACAGARALLINTPNNPTGALYSRETLEGIADICRRHDLWLISDEVYDGMAWDAPHLSPRSLPGMEARTVVIGSLSKSHAMTGSRLGWALAPAGLTRLMEDLALMTCYGLPGYIQKAGLWALEQGEAIESDLAQTFRRRRDIAAAAVEGAAHLRLSPPQGAMYVMLDLRETGLTGLAFAEELLERERIAVMPGESFGKAAAGHVRIALTRPDDELSAALARITAFADRLAAERAA